MPFIVMVGYPSSGKTTRATEIKKFLEEKHQKQVTLINEETLFMNKKEAYKNYTQEKITRGILKSNVEKNINETGVVILDSMNYIKGFRFELHCLSKAIKTSHCVVFCNSSYEFCKEQCLKTQETALTIEQFEDYYKRMENPHQKNRWDNTLFELRETESTPFEEIANALFFKVEKQKEPVCTKPDFNFETNFIFELDKRVQEIIDQIIEKQNEVFMPGVTFSFKNCKEKLKLTKNLSPIELKKLKQEYLKLCKLQPPKNVESISEQFIAFLQTSLDRL